MTRRPDEPDSPHTPDTPDTPDAPEVGHGPTAPDSPASPGSSEGGPGPTAPRRERWFRLRSVVAVGAAGLVLGAAAGVGTTLLVADHDHRDDRPGWGERLQPPVPGGGRGPGGEHNGPGPGSGGLPPATTPEEGEQEQSSDETTPAT